MGLFSLFQKNVKQDDFDLDRTSLVKELQSIRDAISNDRKFFASGFGVIEKRLNSFEKGQNETKQKLAALDDLKLMGRLSLSNKENIETVLKRIETLENTVSQLTQPEVNFTKVGQQGLVNLTKRLVNVDQRLTTGLLENNVSGDSVFPQEIQVDYKLTRGLLNYTQFTNTEKTLLLALYDVQADSEVGAIGVKEVMEKIYGANAKHSKLVYVSKMIKDLQSKGALKRIVEFR